MIIEAKNGLDNDTYCASVVVTRKTIRLPYDVDETTNDTVKMLAERWGPQEFRIHYESAIWRGSMHPFKPFTRPLLIIRVDDTLKPITQKEFAELIKTILSDERIADLFDDKDLYDKFLPRGFQATRHVLRTFPLFRKIKTICMMSVDSDDEEVKWFESLQTSWSTTSKPPSS